MLKKKVTQQVLLLAGAAEGLLTQQADNILSKQAVHLGICDITTEKMRHHHLENVASPFGSFETTA
jgi:hypothetical protein